MLEQAIAENAGRHDLAASDKVIARWIAAELAHLPDAAAAEAMVESQA